MRSGLLAALCSLGACACGAAAEPGQPPIAGERRVVLGTGEADFEPMAGEPRLSLVAGSQGGFHVWASFLVYGFNASLADMLLETRVDGDPEGSLPSRARLMLRETLDESGAPAQSFAGFPAQVRNARCAQDKRVELHLSLTDDDGYVVEDTRHCITEIAERYRTQTCE
jgi:hypothetical protein